MKFMICFIWIFILGQKGGAVQDLATGHKCFGPCDYNKADTNIIAEVIPNPYQRADVPSYASDSENVYSTCIDQYYQFDFDPSNNLKFNKLCGDIYKDCLWSSSSYKWFSSLYPLGRKILLTVNLLMMDNSKMIRIRTQRCGQNPIVLNFKSEKLSTIKRQDYDSSPSIDLNFNDFPSKFNIKESINKDIVVDVLFNIKSSTSSIEGITNQEIKNCSKVNEQYCKHLCKDNKIDAGVKCTMLVGSKEVEIENTNTDCSTKSLLLTTEERSGNGMCEYFRLNNIRPCKFVCIDLPGCSFMCVKKNESRITEMGYQESVVLNHLGLVGSGRWSAADIPINLVLVDECQYSYKLCTNPASCRDKIKGYECINGDYNIVECILNQKSRFWQCPSKQIRFNTSSRLSPESFIYSFYKIANRKLDVKIKLPKMFSELSKQFKVFKTWTSSKRKQVSNFVLKEVEKVFQNFSVQTLNKEKPVYNQCTDSFDAYSSLVDKREKEHSIPIVEKESVNLTQFVKFNIRENDKFASNNKDLITNFIRYKDLDIVNESAEIDSQAKIKGLRYPKIRSNVSAKDSVERYKNSDVIYLALNQNINVTIKFKLKTSVKYSSPSWLYSFEDECGFLDKNRDWKWSVEGCSKKRLPDQDYYCECNHLSNFAMLFSIKIVNEKHLNAFRFLSIFSGIINIISLIFFLIFVLLINSRDKLRLDQLNIAICLLLGTFVFLMGKYTSGNTTLCKLTALFTQFLFLSAFVWKLILGINVVRMITSLTYQNQDSKKVYRFAAISVAYGVPLIITSFSGGFFWIQYGKISDEVCWIQSSSKAFLTFLIPIGIILAVNMLILCFIANTLIRNYIKTHKTKVNDSNELLVFLQLVVAMGLTWLPSYLATIYLAAMYLWVIFFPLQGLMMFLFVVVINRENRQKVSSFVHQKYNSVRSRVTLITDTRSHSKSKFSGEDRSSDRCRTLISDPYNDIDDSNIPMMSKTGQEECRTRPQNSNC